MAKGLEADGGAALAYTWGYPLVRMERVARSYTDVPSPKPATSYRAPLDQIGWATELATAAGAVRGTDAVRPACAHPPSQLSTVLMCSRFLPTRV